MRTLLILNGRFVIMSAGFFSISDVSRSLGFRGRRTTRKILAWFSERSSMLTAAALHFLAVDISPLFASFFSDMTFKDLPNETDDLPEKSY